MPPKRQYIGLLAISMTLLMGCVKQPQFLYVENVEIIGISQDTLDASLDYVIYNPSKSNVELVSSEMNIYYKDNIVGVGILDETTKMIPKDTMALPVRLRVSLNELANNYAELLSQDSSLFVVKGRNEVNYLIDGIKITTQDEIYMNTQEILMSQISGQVDNSNNFRLKSVGVSVSRQLENTEFDITLEFRNQMPIDFTIKKLELSFYFDNSSRKVSDWTLEEPIEVESHAYQDIQATVITDNVNFLRSFSPKWITGKADFIMRGSIALELEGYTFELPIEDEQTIDIRELLRSR